MLEPVHFDHSASTFFTYKCSQQNECQTPRVDGHAGTLAAATLRDKPSSFLGLRMRAHDAVRRRDYGGAVPDLAAIVAADPSNARGWYSLGQSQLLRAKVSHATSSLMRRCHIIATPLTRH